MISSFLLLLPPVAAQAQRGGPSHSLEVSWGPSVPLGNAFLGGGAGLSAFSLRYECRVIPCVGVGISVGYDVRSRSGNTSDILWDGAVAASGGSERAQAVLPLMLTARWYPAGGDKGLFRPYVGAGIGAAWTVWRLSGDTISTMRRAAWGVCVTPEIGTRICLFSPLYVDVGCSYRYCSSGWEAVGLSATRALCPSVGIGMHF